MSLEACLQLLQSRRHSSGGFLPQSESSAPRPDSTSWAVLALRAAGENAEAMQNARAFLVAKQTSHGAVPIGPEHDRVYWPTSLALLAWHGWREGAEAAERALRFLDEVPAHLRDPDATNAINSRLKGWSWISGSSCWVEPTAMAVMAFNSYGRQTDRAKDGVALLKDRELPQGGWNYGSTLVYGTELLPTEETVGMALTALAGHYGTETPRSVAWMEGRFSNLRTPLTLGWAILGLAAWNRRPAGADEAIAKCLARQEVVGPFDTSHLALLLLAAHCPRGLAQLFTTESL